MPLPKVLPAQVHGAARHAPPLQAAGAPSRSGQAADSRTGGGKVVANRYCVEKKLGSGAFGTAFLVTDRKADDDRYEVRSHA